ncbi:MAG: MATE family efflux transporter [Ruminococcus sp.]
MTRIKKVKQMDLTQGIIWKQLLLFALPLLGSSFIQQLYNTVDLLFVGNFIGKEASAAVGASSLMITCLVGFFSGMSVGSGVILSQKIGAKSEREIHDTIHTAVCLSFIGGVTLTVIGYLLAPHFMQWMNTPEQIMQSAVSYLRIYFLSLTSVIIYNIGSGLIRAMGDSRSPMLIQLAGGLVNVAMDTFFVVCFKNGVEGVAWATMFSQTAAAGSVLFYLVRQKGNYHLSLNKLKIHGAIWKDIVKVGIPAGIQSFVITLSNVFAQYYINSFSVDVIAAFTAYIKVELPIYLPIVAFGQAVTTFVGQNKGAGNQERMEKGTFICAGLSVCITLVMSSLMLVFGKYAFGLFNKDVQVINYGIEIIHISFPFYWIYAILEVIASSLRGEGKSLPPMVIILCNICVLRTVLLCLIMGLYHDVRGIAVTYPITWSLTVICLMAYYLMHKKINKLKKGARRVLYQERDTIK